MAEGWTLYTLYTVVVAARVFTQIKLTRNFGAGDIVMIGALVSSPPKSTLARTNLMYMNRCLAFSN
jgi:hypothetical protein